MNRLKLLLLPLLAAGQLSLAAAVPTAAEAATYTVRCESQNNRFTECPVQNRADVTIQRQTSMSPCIEGQTWGYDQRRNRIWVDQGCRADFLVDDGRWGGGGGRGDRWDNNRFVRCESRDNRRAICAIPWRRGDVRVVQQLSMTPCVEGQTWGYLGRNQIWVSGGCRADFGRDGYGGGGWNGPRGGDK